MKKYAKTYEAYHVSLNEAKKFKAGDMWSRDFDYIGMMKAGMSAKVTDGVDKLEKLHSSFEDVNYHKASAPLWDAVVALKAGDKNKAKGLISKFNKLSKAEFDSIGVELKSDKVVDGFEKSKNLSRADFKKKLMKDKRYKVTLDDEEIFTIYYNGHQGGKHVFTYNGTDEVLYFTKDPMK